MGAISVKRADVTIVTDDNPRTEEPAAIRAEIADLPPREVLLAHALAAMQGPLAGLAWTLQGVLTTFVGTLQAIHDKKAQD